MSVSQEFFSKEKTLPRLIEWFNNLPAGQRIVAPGEMFIIRVKAIENEHGEPSFLIQRMAPSNEPYNYLGESVFLWIGETGENLVATDSSFFELSKQVQTTINVRPMVGLLTLPTPEPEPEPEPEPVGFVIKTTDGVVAEIEGPGEVPGTNVSIGTNGTIGGSQLEEVISWPEEKPDWLEANKVSFSGSEYLTKVPDTLPTWITDATWMFYWCPSFNQDISGWNVSNVTNMDHMFYDCPIFNQDLSGWNTSNVTNMSSMFSGCSSFNQDLSGWDTSNVTHMPNMFWDCLNFNGDLSGWDTSNVTNMDSMFYGCSSFNQDISGWNTGNVKHMSYMFRGCSSFNQDLSGWCVSNISNVPSNFSVSATSWTLPKPIWGTCP